MIPTDSAAPKSRRSNADYRWTRAKILTFLHALARTTSVAAAARHVGMSRQSAYRLRARLGKEFADVWDEGLRLGAARKVTVSMQGDRRGAR
ncbi:hypothetical protein EDF56_105231 [Novosphingobium sp. PhB165]|uniref:LysR family transcriptional regulator n=1 Tax=Novosphingobium sp. PhB165 TaxID=2485105 RepID=UPI0010459602|nr:LysR family transcriptional regulator [Novosphingobium sp. PhB165]TCM17885.1 hypothetical protein EDF56_105231 [Novosphingobium sp. PhB165]